MATSLEPAPAALADASSSARRLYLKREDEHELGAFKWRGALPVLEGYKEAGAAAVITASTGNHGAATAWAAARLGLDAIVFVPERASVTKVARIEELGAEIRPAGADMDEAKELAQAEAQRRGVPFFEDGAEPAQYDGYAEIGEEILAQLDEPPAAVVVPVGNGALLGGVARAILAGSPETLRIGVVAAAAPVMADSFDAGRPVPGESSDTFADGMAVRVAIPYAVDVVNEVATHMLRVSERDLAEAVGAFADAGIRVEGSGAAGLAALPQIPAVMDKPSAYPFPSGAIVLVVSGNNIDEDLHQRARNQPQAFPA